VSSVIPACLWSWLRPGSISSRPFFLGPHASDALLRASCPTTAVGLPGRLGPAGNPAPGRQGQPDGIRQGDHVADGDEERLDSRSGAQNRPDHLRSGRGAGDQSPLAGPGSAYEPIKRDLAHPTVGRSSSTPQVRGPGRSDGDAPGPDHRQRRTCGLTVSPGEGLQQDWDLAGNSGGPGRRGIAWGLPPPPDPAGEDRGAGGPGQPREAGLRPPPHRIRPRAPAPRQRRRIARTRRRSASCSRLASAGLRSQRRDGGRRLA